MAANFYCRIDKELVCHKCVIGEKHKSHIDRVQEVKRENINTYCNDVMLEI